MESKALEEEAQRPIVGAAGGGCGEVLPSRSSVSFGTRGLQLMVAQAEGQSTPATAELGRL